MWILQLESLLVVSRIAQTNSLCLPLFNLPLFNTHSFLTKQVYRLDSIVGFERSPRRPTRYDVTRNQNARTDHKPAKGTGEDQSQNGRYGNIRGRAVGNDTRLGGEHREDTDRRA